MFVPKQIFSSCAVSDIQSDTMLCEKKSMVGKKCQSGTCHVLMDRNYHVLFNSFYLILSVKSS